MKIYKKLIRVYRNARALKENMAVFAFWPISLLGMASLLSNILSYNEFLETALSFYITIVREPISVLIIYNNKKVAKLGSGFRCFIVVFFRNTSALSASIPR